MQLRLEDSSTMQRAGRKALEIGPAASREHCNRRAGSRTVKIKSLGWMKINENYKTSECSFSTVSKPPIARVGAFFSIF